MTDQQKVVIVNGIADSDQTSESSRNTGVGALLPMNGTADSNTDHSSFISRNQPQTMRNTGEAEVGKT